MSNAIILKEYMNRSYCTFCFLRFYYMLAILQNCSILISHNRTCYFQVVYINHIDR